MGKCPFDRLRFVRNDQQQRPRRSLGMPAALFPVPQRTLGDGEPPREFVLREFEAAADAFHVHLGRDVNAVGRTISLAAGNGERLLCTLQDA
jgi:hypothetical protein